MSWAGGLFVHIYIRRELDGNLGTWIGDAGLAFFSGNLGYSA